MIFDLYDVFFVKSIIKNIYLNFTKIFENVIFGRHKYFYNPQDKLIRFLYPILLLPNKDNLLLIFAFVFFPIKF